MSCKRGVLISVPLRRLAKGGRRRKKRIKRENIKRGREKNVEVVRAPIEWQRSSSIKRRTRRRHSEKRDILPSCTRSRVTERFSFH